jgi:hypothetical protein
MKRLLIFIATAASVLAAYLLFKNCVCIVDEDGRNSDTKKQRHITTAFSKAKQHTAE